jgi:hypothetical protein
MTHCRNSSKISLKNRRYRGKINTRSSHIHDRSLSWLGIPVITSLKYGGVNPVLWTQSSPLSELMRFIKIFRQTIFLFHIFYTLWVTMLVAMGSRIVKWFINISWRSILLVEETGVPIHRKPSTCRNLVTWRTLSYNGVSSSLRLERISNSEC